MLGLVFGETALVNCVFIHVLQDLAKNGTRELSSYENKVGWKTLGSSFRACHVNRSPSVQATREVEGLIFKLVSNVTKHRKLVDILGTAKDTLDHRHEIAIINAAIQEVRQSNI